MKNFTFSLLSLIIISIIIIIFTVFIYSRYMEYKLFGGFWETDSLFNIESGLDLCMLRIQPPSFNLNTISNIYPSYLVMKSADNVIICDKVNIHLTYDITVNPFVNNKKIYKAKFMWEDSNTNYDFFPNEQTLEYYPCLNKLVFLDQDEIKLILYKSHELTDT